MRGVRGQDVSPTVQGDVPSAGRPVPALPEHDRVLVETVDLQRWVLAADPGSSAWIHPTTGSPCAPCRTRHWSRRAWSRQPPQPALTDLKEPRSAGRSTVRDAGAPSCTPVARRGSAPVYPLIGYLRGSFRPPARVWRTPGRRPAFAVPACSWRAECPDLDGQSRNGHRADARADRRLLCRGVRRCCSGL